MPTHKKSTKTQIRQLRLALAALLALDEKSWAGGCDASTEDAYERALMDARRALDDTGGDAW